MGSHWESFPSIVLYAQEKGVLDRVLPDVVRIFTSADGTLFPETCNELNAYFATVPGNYRHNVRRHYRLNSNYADFISLHDPARRDLERPS